jgi:transcriptional regulator with XRE-family HTH domain
MDDLPHFAGCLRKLRTDAKMTQHELAERAGVTRGAVARMEIGTREPSWIMVQKLAHALNVPVSAFVDPEIIPPVVEVKRGPGRPRLDAGPVETPAPNARPKRGRKR